MYDTQIGRKLGGTLFQVFVMKAATLPCCGQRPNHLFYLYELVIDVWQLSWVVDELTICVLVPANVLRSEGANCWSVAKSHRHLDGAHDELSR
eukprot:SAG11_NODE_20821_length_437_cov_1.269231_1_plen_93_part_00